MPGRGTRFLTTRQNRRACRKGLGVKNQAASSASFGCGLILLLVTVALGVTFTEAAAQGEDIKPRLLGPRQVVARDLPPPSAASLAEVAIVAVPWREPGLGPRAAARSAAPGPQANTLDASFAAGFQPMAAPTASLLAFEGLDNDDNAALAGLVVTPPDPQLAVGPNHVVEMVNVVGRIYGKTGNPIQTFTLASFFGVTAGVDKQRPQSDI